MLRVHHDVGSPGRERPRDGRPMPDRTGLLLVLATWHACVRFDLSKVPLREQDSWGERLSVRSFGHGRQESVPSTHPCASGVVSIRRVFSFFSHQSAPPMPMTILRKKRCVGQPQHPASVDVHPRHRRDEVFRRVGGHVGGVQGTRPSVSGSLRGKGERDRSSAFPRLFWWRARLVGIFSGKIPAQGKSGIARGRGGHREVDGALSDVIAPSFGYETERSGMMSGVRTLANSPSSSSSPLGIK